MASALFVDRWTQRFLSALAVVFAAYMIYSTFYGPYRTTLVHLALFLIVMMTIYFLDHDQAKEPSYNWLKRCWNLGFAALSVFSVGYLIVEFDRLIEIWGAMFLTPLDVIAGAGMVLVVLEAARRQSIVFFGLAVSSILYILYGDALPSVLRHPGMEFDRFIYLTAYTEEGIFGSGLTVAASYLFMFMLLSSAMNETRTGDFIVNVANAYTGRKVGGPAKGAMFASAGLGTMVGSSIGNVVSTGTFTIPLMKRVGFKPHVAGAIEVVVSEGAQFLPPVMGAGAFLMAELTGIPYATIALGAFLPAILYYVSTFLVIHIEALRMGVGGLPESEVPNARQVLADGWHLLIPPAVLLYLLMIENYTPSFAGIVCIGVSLVVALLRPYSRYNWRSLLRVFDKGVRQSAALTGLIAGIGLVQQAMVTTGLGGRLTEIMLSVSGGDALATAALTVVAATILGMGMPTAISYLLLALFAAPAMEAVGYSQLATHLFLFYFAIKSGSTPPVAVVAIVAAGIAQANWWKTGVAAFYYSLPGFVVAFMFLHSPALLFQGDGWMIAIGFATAAVGVLG
ncbi:MAG: TRAP transporter fused permease subunit, partial [Alphaproteobacteria bacterium]